MGGDDKHGRGAGGWAQARLRRPPHDVRREAQDDRQGGQGHPGVHRVCVQRRRSIRLQPAVLDRRAGARVDLRKRDLNDAHRQGRGHREGRRRMRWSRLHRPASTPRAACTAKHAKLSYRGGTKRVRTWRSGREMSDSVLPSPFAAPKTEERTNENRESSPLSCTVAVCEVFSRKLITANTISESSL